MVFKNSANFFFFLTMNIILKYNDIMYTLICRGLLAIEYPVVAFFCVLLASPVTIMLRSHLRLQ